MTAQTVATLEMFEPRLLLSGLDPTIYAQYMLELINRARANPTAEATRLGISLNEGLTAGTSITTAAKQPLTFNSFLIQAASGHNTWMSTNGIFDHPETAGSPTATPQQRMQLAGYEFFPQAGSGENLAKMIDTAAIPNLIADTATLYEALFVDTSEIGRGHRINLMNGNFQEVGIAVDIKNFLGTQSILITQDFAFQNQDPFITGVVFDDLRVLADNFYTPGEGLGGITVTAVEHGAGGQTFTTTTFGSGGYSLQVPAGTYDVQFSGGGLEGVLISSNVVVTNQNVKVDLRTDNPPAQANLTILAAKSSALKVYALPGAEVSFSVSVRNTGTARETSDFNVITFLSDTNPPTSGDLQVDTYTINGLNVGATNTQTVTFTAPIADGTYYFASFIDISGVTADATLSGSVYTLIVGQPDLEPAFTKVSLPVTMVPGDKGSVSIRIENNGTIPGAAEDIEVYASQVNTAHAPAAGDVVLATVDAENTVVGPDGSKTITIKFNITEDMAVATWYILADVDVNNDQQESDDTNNIILDPTARDLVWQFGTFGDRKNVKLKVHDSLDTLVTFAMTGGGWGEVQGGAAFTDVILHDTGVRSSMSLSTSGPKTTIADLTSLGSIKSISAAKADITGNVDIAGGISTLKLGDVDNGGTTITLHSDPLITLDPKTKAAITLGFVSDLALDANDEPIKSLSVIEWQGEPGNAITAPSLGSLTTRGQKESIKKGLAFSAGDFDPTVDLTGAAGTARVHGSLSGQWNALSVKSLSVGVDIEDFTLTLSQPVDLKLKALGSLYAKGWIRQSRILSDGNIGTVTAGGLWDCDIFAGVTGTPPAAGLPNPATDFDAQATIKTVTVKGTADDGSGHSTINSNIAAYTLGSISLRNALATNTPSTPWGLAGHTLASYSYRDAGIRYSWRPSAGGVPTEPTGDFTVLLV